MAPLPANCPNVWTPPSAWTGAGAPFTYFANLIARTGVLDPNYVTGQTTQTLYAGQSYELVAPKHAEPAEKPEVKPKATPKTRKSA